jgi:hypothetical protein
MEHSLHLAVGHILSTITSVDAEKTHKARDDDDDNGDDNDNDNEFSAGAATFDDCSASLSDALRKLLGLIVQIRKSPQAHVFFKRMYREVNIPEHDLMLFVRTCWASMFACLEWALKLRPVCSYIVCQYIVLIHAQAIARFMQLADDSDEVPALHKKKYIQFRLSKDEWELLKLLHEVIKVSPPSSCPCSFCALYRS